MPNTMRILILLTVTVAGSLSVAANTPVDSGAADFQLRDHRGRQWSLDDFNDSRLVAVVFLGTECPLAQLYATRLEALQTEYSSNDVSIIGVISNTQDSLTEVADWVAEHKLTFPVLLDRGNRLADQLTAERTPEAFLLDEQRQIQYRGRIDDQYSVGRARVRVQRRDLAIAIDELLAGQPVSVARTEAPGCLIGRVKEVTPRGDITWASHIASIFHRRCLECHRDSEIAPFELRSYDDVIGWEDTILEVIADNRMPPWFANPQHGKFGNDTRLSDQEKQLIRTWVKNGMPPGDPEDMPDPPQFVSGWRMPEPDQIIAMSDQPFSVPAEGVVDYQYFEVDPGWDDDVWIQAAEARPDQRSVVHHIIAYVIPPGNDDVKDRARNRSMLVGYAPGSQPNILDGGRAMRVPAGSTLLFEMHYTPNGIATQDRSYIGVRFIDPEQVTEVVRGRYAVNSEFEIPPQATSHEVTAEYVVRRDELLLDMTPHMHLRGKSFRYEAVFPDGSQEILLDVPFYDFNWQLTYELAKPRLLPAGTRIVCTATYDNSADNTANPDPTIPVHWGDQSFEEMMIGFMTVIPAKDTRVSATTED